jgi:hypothetical protein
MLIKKENIPWKFVKTIQGSFPTHAVPTVTFCKSQAGATVTSGLIKSAIYFTIYSYCTTDIDSRYINKQISLLGRSPAFSDLLYISLYELKDYHTYTINPLSCFCFIFNLFLPDKTMYSIYCLFYPFFVFLCNPKLNTNTVPTLGHCFFLQWQQCWTDILFSWSGFC